jgi:hypothetical protein
MICINIIPLFLSWISLLFLILGNRIKHYYYKSINEYRRLSLGWRYELPVCYFLITECSNIAKNRAKKEFV